jgi:hypothetical protein
MRRRQRKNARKFLCCFIAELEFWKADGSPKRSESFGLFEEQGIDLTLCNPTRESMAGATLPDPMTSLFQRHLVLERARSPLGAFRQIKIFVAEEVARLSRLLDAQQI